MNLVYTIGETIYDIIFKQGQPVAARPGGSMLNTAVSLGRCGLKVEMITEVGADKAGQIVLDFLMENGVSTSYVRPLDGFKTPIALAFLDENGNATYSFYSKYPESRLDLNWPEPTKGDVVLFGAFYSLDPAIRQKISRIVKNAKHNGAFIVYDPNIRKNHLKETKGYMSYVEENFAMADIVRGSDEDFENLFGLTEGEEVFERIRATGCNYLIYTRNSRGAELFSDKARVNVPAAKIQVVSTIGAGDSFNAGIIYGLVSKGLTESDLSKVTRETWMELIGFGVTFAADVCGSYDNYISASFNKIEHG
jgi:fructokinase